jgi:hypothetical protein
VVALARRLARILFAMWRDGVPYDAVRTEPTRAHGAAAIMETAAAPSAGPS